MARMALLPFSRLSCSSVSLVPMGREEQLNGKNGGCGGDRAGITRFAETTGDIKKSKGLLFFFFGVHW